ncbi:MAG: MerR family transcriptional regulator [Paracoccaceae bacterium]
MDKSPDAFRTISEVAEVLETPAHVLRFWESRFPQIRPVKRAGGRRYYRPADVALLTGIKRLLHDEGMTIRGVQKILREQGIQHVAGQSEEISPEEAALEAAMVGRYDDEADLPGAEVEEATAAALAAALTADDPEAAAQPEALWAAPPDAIAPPLPLDPASSEQADSTQAWLDSLPPQLPPQLPVPDPVPVPAPPAAPPAPAAQLPVSVQTPVATRLRALPIGGMAAHKAELHVIARQIALLRDRLAGRLPGA